MISVKYCEIDLHPSFDSFDNCSNGNNDPIIR